jgi:two-component system alkaline phosphatase synthesis response regulator PhoP
MAGLKNVLIVEDDVMIRELYRSTLVDDHYRVEVAGDATELYKKLESFHPECVLLDIMLPGISGLEILKELRNNPKYGCQQAKIIMLTNLAQRSVSDSATESGADGFILKVDILPKDLRKIIASL